MLHALPLLDEIHTPLADRNHVDEKLLLDGGHVLTDALEGPRVALNGGLRLTALRGQALIAWSENSITQKQG